MKEKQIVAIVAVIAVALVAVGWWLWRPANNANFPDGTIWLCTSPTCGHHTLMTMEQLGEYNDKHYGEPVKCEKCKQLALRAVKCPNCGKVTPQDRGSTICPACNKPLYLNDA